MCARVKCRLLLLVCTVLSMIGHADKSIGNHFISPIQNFEPSWTASSAGGTTMAIPFALNDIANLHEKKDSIGSDAVLLIFRSTSPVALSSQFRGDAMKNRETERTRSALFTLSGLRIFGYVYTNSDCIPLSLASQRWALLGSTAICSMTGFAPDIDYLTRYLQKLIDNHRTMYESTSMAKTASMSPMKLVESLAEELQEAGQWQGGRPFGVQILMVGLDRIMEQSSSLGIFTLDPSGVYRRWRGAAAVGQNGKIIRDRLFKYWFSQNSTREFHDDGVEALYSGLHASVLSRIDESVNLERSDIYEAVLVWQVKNELCVAQIDRTQINDLRESILNNSNAKPIKNG